MRIPFLLIACGLLALPGFGQPSPADTARVLALLQHGSNCLFKPGEAKSDLDSALQLAQQASALSRRLNYRHGLDDAAMLTANIHVEAKRWPMAWMIYPTLTDTSRINLLALMVAYRITDSDMGREKFDSAQQYMTRLMSLCDTLHNVHCVSNAYQTVANAYREAGDKKRSLQLWSRGFPRVRSFGDIIEESRYGWNMTDWYWNDSSTNPILIPLLEQMTVDEERLLSKTANEEQFSAISGLAKTGNGYYLYKQTDLGIHIDSLAIRVNQRLHQHNALPWFILSYIYSAQGRTKEGLTAALDALRIAETDNGPIDGVGYEAAAKIYFVTGDFDKSLEYFNKALPLFEKKPKLIIDPSGMFYRAIQTHLKQHHPAEGLKLLRLFQQYQSAIVIDYRTKIFFALSTGNCYAGLGRIDSAEDAYRKALTYVPDPGWSVDRTSIYYNLATFYTDTRQYTKARPILETLTADSTRAQSSFTTLETAHELLYRVDSALHDYPSAMANLRRYQKLHDSLTNVAKNKQLAEMNIQYETDKKNQHIADLEKQAALQTRLQQATVRQDRIVRNSLIGGSILLALLAAGLYSRYRAKQRTNRLLETRQQAIDASNRQLQQLSTRQQKLIREKEWLVREIHHRVKNNLQIVISLLHLQSEQLKDEIAISAFEEISGRINSISLVHKKLYLEGENLATINMRDYVSELVGHLRKGFGQRRDIHFRFEVGPIFLDVAQSVPIGLLLNEAITNAMKYAFPPEAVEYPEIRVTLRELSPANVKRDAPIAEHAGGGLELTIADNGVGLKQPFDPEANNSLGMQLIHTMAQQLEATLSVTNDHGLTIAVRFQRTDAILETDAIPEED